MSSLARTIKRNVRRTLKRQIALGLKRIERKEAKVGKKR